MFTMYQIDRDDEMVIMRNRNSQQKSLDEEYGLSDFERDIMLPAAGQEIDTKLDPLNPPSEESEKARDPVQAKMKKRKVIRSKNDRT